MCRIAPHATAASARAYQFLSSSCVSSFGSAAASLRRHVLERSHIVQPVGQLDQKHAHIIGDRQQQFAEIFRLLCLFGNEVEFFELGQPLHQSADIVTEQAVDFRARGLGILNSVVQEGRRDRRVVKLEVGENSRDFDRMGEIRIAGCAPLLTVRLHRIDVGTIEKRLIRVRVVPAHPFDQVVLPHHRRFSCRRRLFDR